MSRYKILKDPDSCVVSHLYINPPSNSYKQKETTCLNKYSHPDEKQDSALKHCPLIVHLTVMSFFICLKREV